VKALLCEHDFDPMTDTVVFHVQVEMPAQDYEHYKDDQELTARIAEHVGETIAKALQRSHPVPPQHKRPSLR
jgi:hypothetical protein